jgi:osmotically-inducible protein OsmY
VTNVVNSITVKPSLPSQSIRNRIQESFRRLADVDVGQLSVDTLGSHVTLRGKVQSWAERDEAERSAWSAPGVTNVTNQLDVRN